MTKLPAALLTLALVACAHVAPPRPCAWTVEGAGPVDQALAMAEAARRVYPGRYGCGVVHLAPEIAALCYGPQVDRCWVVNGCLMRDGVAVRWPLPGCADLGCTALAHELAHYAGAPSEGAADAGGLLISQEYRRASP